MRALLTFSAIVLAGLSLAAVDPTAVPVKCLNGGVNKEDVTQCDCQSYWSGDLCENIVCVNGGYATPIDAAPKDRQVCHCPKGYYGIHCDAVKQARPVQGVFKTDKSFSLYIHNELTDWYGMKAMQRLKNETRTILADYNYDQFNLFMSKRANAIQDSAYPDVWAAEQYDSAKAFLDKLDEKKAERTRTYTCAAAEELSYQKLLDSLKEKTIEDGVILMFTQYPPKSDPDAIAALKEHLRAFRIKLNVIVGADDILLDCYSKKNKGAAFDELTELVHFTDGEIATFLIEEDESPDELLPSFIRASASPQSHSRAASDSCAIGLEFEFQTDPYPNTYYITARTVEDDPAEITGSCSSGGDVAPLAVSTYNEFAVSSILSGAQQTCKITVKAKGGCLSTVYSVGGAKDVDRFDIFHSFATSEDMDSDSIHAFKKESYFLTMHIDISSNIENELPKYLIVEFGGVVMVKNEAKQVVFEKNLVKRGSTFDYQSEEAFACPESGISWIQLNLEGFNINGDSVAVLNRIIHVNCEDRKPVVDGSRKLLRMMDDANTNVLPTFALMYSNELPTPQFSRFILEGVNEQVIKDKFSSYGYIRFDGMESRDFNPTDDFKTFRTEVYDYAPDSTIKYQSNFPQNIEKLTVNPAKAVTSDSLVSIAIKRPMVDPDVVANWAKNLAELANLGSKMLFWGDVDTVKIDQDSDSLKVYTRMAAISAGHVVLIDMNDFSDDEDEDGDYPYYVSLALRDLYSFGPSQRLLAYSNLEWTQTSTTTSQSSNIGTLQIPEGTTEVFVSITLNVENPQDVAPVFMMSIVLEGVQNRIVLNLDPTQSDFTQYGAPGSARSNLYTANFTVVGGESYDGVFTVLAMTRFNGAHIRFWTPRTGSDVIPELTYVGFDMKKTQPNDYIGAALQLKGDVDETISLRFLNEKGEDAQRLDHDQSVAVIKEDGKVHFVPYFCNSNQSEWQSRDMYTVQITYGSTNFTYFRPMLCTETGTLAKDICSVTDDDGNVFCQVSNPPFVRGPSGQLIDCSGAGQVYYDGPTAKYACACQKGFDGVSCQSSSCDIDVITHLPGERDTEYRTLTFVFISPAGDDDPPACSYIFQYWADDASKLFQQQSYDNIWQFTFLMYFNDGTVKTMYRGPSRDAFMGVFTYLKSDAFGDIAETFCGVNVQQQPLDMADVYNSAVESVGRDSRGIVFLYASQSFLETAAEFQLDNVIVSEEFYRTVQAYQQHIYMITPVLTEDIVALTTSSGGVAIKMIDDFGGSFNNAESTTLKVFDELISGTIGWVGVLTKKTDRTWTTKDEVKLFISSNTTFPAISDCSGSPFPSEPFPFDTDDEDKTKSELFVIPGPSKICLQFDPAAKDALIQVVILTTKTTMEYALLGQGQGEVDKHSAGATTNSSKPVHISFDRSDDEYTIKPLSTNWREAARMQCTFAQEFIPFEIPFEVSGPFVVDFDITKLATADDPSTAGPYSLSVPLVVTEEIDCIVGHGVFNHTGSYCSCNDNWSGPTCAQPSCGDGGQLNSHGDHCDCTGAAFGGLFCKEE